MGERFRKIKNKRRLITQFAFTALTNGYVAGWAGGKIFQGSGKQFCVPGLNCYSCPGAFGSCPIGALQAVINSRNYTFSFYLLGFLTLVGALCGRFVCGFLCPFGLIQDLLYKIPFFKKLKTLPGDRFLKYFRYVVLAVFVILLPSIVTDIIGQGSPWFCKYICPSGTLTAGVPLVLSNESLRDSIGVLFYWKIALLVVTLLLSILCYRPFCRYVCPLGAVYGCFNPVSLYRYTVNPDLCTACGACAKKCGFGIRVWEHPNSVECIRCGACKDICPQHAISSGIPHKSKGASQDEHSL